MSEDDKREKRKKIEQNRAIKKRTIDDVCESSNDSQPRPAKLEPTDDDEEPRKLRKTNPVQINLLNMASASSKTYQKKQLKYGSNAEQLVPFPSPGVPEPSSPGGATVAESRTCNVFNQNNNRFDSNRSRSVEIYQISKPQEIKTKISENYNQHCADSSIIKNILNADASKPLDVAPPYKVEDRYGYVQNDSEYLLNEAKILELTKNNKNVILESTKEGNRIIVITKDPENERLKEMESSSKTTMGLSEAKESGSGKYYEDGDPEEGSTSLLSSLINNGGSREVETRSGNFRSDVAEEVLQDIPR